MPLNPEDVHSVVFRKPSMGMRGYDGDEVDAFLDEVEEEMLRLRRENQTLREQLQPSGGPASQQVIARLGARLQRLQQERDQAEADAERIRAELEGALATPPPAPAEPSTQDPSICVIAVARRTADECLRTAERQAQQLLTTARTKADQLTSEAELNAATIDSDARHRHTEAIAGLERRRSDVMVDIEQLRRFAVEYGQALRAHVVQRLDELAGPKT